jgi:hypothetical protein
VKWIKTENNEFLCVWMLSRFYVQKFKDGSDKICAENPSGEIFVINSFSSREDAWQELLDIINGINETDEDR